MIKRTDIEIMAPVGSYESLRAAIAAGANSVYLGIGQLNMRSASAANFTADDMAEINRIAHENGVKTYLTINTIIYDTELELMHSVVDRAKAEGVDAIIASDMSVILYAYHAGVEVHISTQCNISNSEAAKFYSQWADVVVLARELSLEQIAMVHKAIVEQDIRGPKGELLKIEMFSHGALCMSISGKCYLSEHETACSANRGACRQICRRKYLLTDVQTGQQLATDGRYILSPKDLCTIDFLDKFIAAGVRVLKIEGRARGAEYVKRVVESYDAALKAMEAGEYTPELAEELKEKLLDLTNLIAQIKSKINGHLIVSAPGGVQSATRIAASGGKLALNEAMYILRILRNGQFATLYILKDGGKTLGNGLSVGLGYYALSRQHSRVSHRALDILFVHTGINVNGGVKIVGKGAGLTCGPARPHFFHKS